MNTYSTKWLSLKKAARTKLALEQGKYMLEDAKACVNKQQTSVAVDTLQRHGDLIETLLEQEPNARLVVMGRQGEQHRGSSNW
ncbi:hypothetical protein PEC18_38040 [Paucibacter sp. O1-1]|nr:hypothetical protein [Paucibacter sp. O1-1]MDA3831428.1 hypothetical protein [Paucibacter sp. O1-1]